MERKKKNLLCFKIDKKYLTIAYICVILNLITLVLYFSSGNLSSFGVGATTPGYTVMITGGAGFIGSHISEYYEKNKDCKKIIIVDDLSTGNIKNLSGLKKVEFHKISITDRVMLRDILQRNKVKFIFHLGAKISVEESMTKPIAYNNVNTIGTIVLLQEAVKGNVESLVFSSSAAIYGRDPKVPKVEDFKPEIVSPYAQTKLDGEYYLSMYKDKLRVVSLRYFNVFGERQDPNSQYASVIPQFIQKACLRKEDLNIYGDGKQTRDFIYVKDIAMTNVYAANKLKSGEVYNVGYQQSLSINQLAKIIIDYCKSPSKIKYREPRKGDVRVSFASNQKLKASGWKPKYEFKKSLEKTVEWFLQSKERTTKKKSL